MKPQSGGFRHLLIGRVGQPFEEQQARAAFIQAIDALPNHIIEAADAIRGERAERIGEDIMQASMSSRHDILMQFIRQAIRDGAQRAQ